MKQLGPALLGALLLVGCFPVRTSPPPPSERVPSPPPAPVVARPVADAPPVAREFRGVWVASVSNIDWPSRRDLSSDQQRAELLTILDRAAALKLNAVILQVRPAGDALYASPLEPWSEYLTGEQGRAPEPYYDPLEFAVREAHRRGLELHAWFNPFRARHSSGRSGFAASHIGRELPGVIRRYGSQLWMDPAEPAVRERSLQVILDVVRRYDVDGVHIDDYFYPYREEDRRGRTIPFPDDAAWESYRASGGRLERGDWRRSHVDGFVERLYGAVKAEKPWVKVGISPFGIWRPGYPAQIVGLDSYHEIFADSRKWLHNGWLDYFAPQLYWPIEQTAQSYPVLLDWWVQQNRHARHIWPGNHSNRVGTRPRDWPAREIAEQIRLTREQPGAGGNLLFSARSLLLSPDGLADRLASAAYPEPALVPASPWLGAESPGRPAVEARPGGGGVQLSLRPADDGREVRLWAVRTRTGRAWRVELLPADRRTFRVGSSVEEVVVTAVGRTGLESPGAALLTAAP